LCLIGVYLDQRPTLSKKTLFNGLTVVLGA
jgi:hypothetical protein